MPKKNSPPLPELVSLVSELSKNLKDENLSLKLKRVFSQQNSLNRLVKRKMVVLMKEKNIPDDKVSEIIGVHPKSVSKMSKKWENSVFYQDAKRSGRPKKLDNHQLQELQKIFNDDRSSSASSIKKNWERTSKIPISVRTIQRLRKKFGYRLKYPRTRPILSQINISKRLSYARKYSRERWDNHVFIDESDFQLYPQRKSLWLKRRERLFFHRPRHSPKVKILCGISIHGQIFLRMCILKL